ncbi:two component transcriptional regulator, LuxR family [Actinoalloteichus hymeniacidonis]|uniref:Two component transcriptional regulator, LuxR family n=1 Tax=Actinoalloteichus hymeniacidonis TaxID=340345 RepID=A0AAC9HR05_9PSEU|nr:two component transcriptional regulator, LuxR family [Actinoalloteichus hymeniacidonis]
MIRVLIADDDALVRSGLTMMLGGGEGIEVVAQAADGLDALDAVRRLQPDVVLMDIRMPRMDGLAATEELRSSGATPAIIVLTTFDTDEHVMRALRLGANGFLLKDTPPRRIIEAVRRVAVGETMLSPAVTDRLIGHVVAGTGERAGSRTDTEDTDERRRRRLRARTALNVLTDREREVAEAIGAGRSNAEIAARLHVTVATVKAYVSRVLAKLECANRVQIAIVVHESRD